MALSKSTKVLGLSTPCSSCKRCSRMHAVHFRSRRGGGVHDLWMDGGLPPGFKKVTLFQLPTVAVILTFTMNFGGKLPMLYNVFENF